MMIGEPQWAQPIQGEYGHPDESEADDDGLSSSGDPAQPKGPRDPEVTISIKGRHITHSILDELPRTVSPGGYMLQVSQKQGGRWQYRYKANALDRSWSYNTGSYRTREKAIKAGHLQGGRSSWEPKWETAT